MIVPTHSPLIFVSMTEPKGGVSAGACAEEGYAKTKIKRNRVAKFQRCVSVRSTILNEDTGFVIITNTNMSKKKKK